MVATNTDTGTPGASDSRMPPTAETSAKTTEVAIAATGATTTRAAAAAGVDQQRHHEECPDDLDSLGGYHAHQCGEHNSQGAHWHAAGGRDLRIDGGKQERSVADRQHGDHEQTNHGQHGQPGVTDPDDLAGQQRKTGPGRFRWARSRSTR